MKNKIAKLLPKDKLLHFFVGFFIYVGLSIFFTPLLSLLFTTVLAVLNEVNDVRVGKKEAKKKGVKYVNKFSGLDIIFTVAPGITLILTNLL